MATQAQAFIAQIAPLAQKNAQGRTKWSLPSVCIAQACCESAYGTSTKMIKANAVFGIKVGNSKAHFGTAWKDKAYSTQTKECYDGKTYTNITDMFRAYDSVEDSVIDYYDMLASCSRYKACLNQTDAKTCITAIKNAGYATSPTYITTIMSIINKYSLTQYDSVVTGTAATTSANGYTIGKNYTLQANMYIRDSANGDKTPYTQLTSNAKNNATMDTKGYGILKKGTVVTCKSVETKDGAVWIKIPSGWICGTDATGKVYVK